MRAVLGLALILGGSWLGAMIVLGHIGPGAETSKSMLLPKVGGTTGGGSNHTVR